MTRTLKPLAAGILDIICGAGTLLAFILTLIESALLRAGSMMGDAILALISFVAPGLGSVIYLVAYLAIAAGAGASEFLYTFVALPFLLLGLISIVGGVFAIMRRRWGLALAGAIAGLVCNFIPGVIAVVLTGMARTEFKT